MRLLADAANHLDNHFSTSPGLGVTKNTKDAADTLFPTYRDRHIDQEVLQLRTSYALSAVRVLLSEIRALPVSATTTLLPQTALTMEKLCVYERFAAEAGAFHGSQPIKLWAFAWQIIAAGRRSSSLD
jgi:hypothetical protein